MEQKNNIVDSEIISGLEFHTKLSKEQRKTLINWFNKQNIEFQILIFDEQKNQFFKLKNEGIDKKLLSLASFLLAIKHFYDKEQLLKSKNKSQTLSELGGIAKLERIKLKKEKPKQIKPLKHIGAKRQVKTHSIKFRLSIKKAAVQKAAFVFPQS